MAHFTIERQEALLLADIIKEKLESVENNPSERYKLLGLQSNLELTMHSLKDDITCDFDVCASEAEETDPGLLFELLTQEWGTEGLLEALDPEVVEEWAVENTSDIERLLNNIDKSIIKEYIKKS